METTQDTNATAAPNPLERRLDMAVTLVEIEREVEQQLKRIAKTAKMAGFRPGKVPMKMVAQMYGGQAHSDALGAAIEKAFSELVKAQNLRVAGQPRVEPKEASGEGQMEFTAIFEVFPEFQIAEISARSMEKPVLAVGDAEVDKTIEVLRKQRTTYAPAGRPAEKGDRLLIDFTGKKNGEEFEGGKATDYPVFVGGGMMLPDFEAALEGVTSGQVKTFDVTFPDDYHAKDLAGNKVEFTVTVKQVEQPQLPLLRQERRHGDQAQRGGRVLGSHQVANLFVIPESQGGEFRVEEQGFHWRQRSRAARSGLFHAVQHLVQRHGGEGGGIIGHGVGDNELPVPQQAATGIDHVGHIAFALAFVGLDERLAQASDDLRGLVQIEQERAEAILPHRTDTVT